MSQGLYAADGSYRVTDDALAALLAPDSSEVPVSWADGGTQSTTTQTDNTVNSPLMGYIRGILSLAGGITRITNPTAAADAGLVRFMADKLGRLVVVNQHTRDLVTRSAVVTLTDTTETSLIAAGGAGIFYDMVSIKLNNTSATAVRCDIRDVLAGTVIDTFYLPAGDIRGIVYTVPFKQTTANSAWTVKISASVTDVRIVAQFVTNK